MAPHNAYRCKGDDRWCAISVFDEAQWLAFAEAIGSPDWTGDERFSTNEGRLANQDELDSNIETWTINYTPHEVMHKLQSAGVIAGSRPELEGEGGRRPAAQASRLHTGGRTRRDGVEGVRG